MRHRMRILVADDDRVSRELLVQTLQEWDHEPVPARDGIEALRILRDDSPPTLMILDWMMPGMSGPDVCRFVRKICANDPYIYILVLTGRKEKKDLIEALEAGADDFIQKPFDPAELRVRVRAAVRILELQSALLMKAKHDSLTELLNHGAILEALAKEFNRCRRDKKPVSVLLADLDHFKNINDQYGHQAGDAVLRITADKIRSNFRSYDSVGRYGGEEFLIVLPGCSIEDAYRLSDRLRSSVAEATAESPVGSIPFTISIGIACATDFAQTSPVQLVHAADEALYKAKEKGRNRVEISSFEEETGHATFF